MEEKYSINPNTKNMKQLIPNKCLATLFSGILSLFLMVTVSSCQKDTFREGNSSATSNLSPLSMDVNLGDIELDPEVAIQYAEASTARGIEMTTPKANEKVPKFDFAKTGQDEEDFPVFIALFGERQRTNCYAHATWKLIKEPNTTGNGDRYFVRAKGKINFISGFAPDTTKIKEGENWRLHAIYTPNNGTGTWDGANQVYKWSAKKVVKQLYGAEQKLTIGTDIDIPFVLGCRTPEGNRLSWFDGYPMTAAKKLDKKTKKYYWDFGIKQLYEDPKTQTKPLNPRFKMLGSLMAIDLKNNMRPQESKQDLDTDQTILDGLTYRPTYDFQIRGFHIESTQAVTSVAYSFKNLPMDLDDAKRQMLSMFNISFSPDVVRYIGRSGAYVSETPQSIPTQENPTRIEIPFEQANYADLNRQTTSGKLYFWMTEVDASGKKPNENIGYGTAIWANLYNKTLQVPMGSTFVYNAQQPHKTGTAYSSTATLLEELRLNPLARMGFDYLAGDPTNGQACTFARSTATNSQRPNDQTGDPGAGQPYAYDGSNPVLKNFQNKSFKVNYLRDLSHQGDGSNLVVEYGDLYWHVPDRFDLYSVFPYIPQKEISEFGGLTYKEGTDDEVHAGKIHRATGEQARIDGVKYTDLKSIYYRNQDANFRKQTYALSRNTFYAFRFIGTPMAVAVRYTEGGKWYNPNPGSAFQNVPVDPPVGGSTTVINPRSFFSIEMKTIGNAFKFKDMTMDEAEKYLKEVIVKDDFWQNGTELRPEVIKRTIHVNGIWSSDRTNDFQIDYGGQAIFIWTRELNDQWASKGPRRTVPGVYQNQRIDNGGLYYHNASILEIGTKGTRGYYVLPWLSLHQPEKH